MERLSLFNLKLFFIKNMMMDRVSNTLAARLTLEMERMLWRSIEVVSLWFKDGNKYSQKLYLLLLSFIICFPLIIFDILSSCEEFHLRICIFSKKTGICNAEQTWIQNWHYPNQVSVPDKAVCSAICFVILYIREKYNTNYMELVICDWCIRYQTLR